MLNVLKDIKVIRVANAAAAAQTQIISSIVNAEGFDAACAIALLNTVTSGCQLSLQLQDNTANQQSGMTNAGTAASITDSGGATSNGLLITDVINICAATGKQYIQAVLNRASDNAAVDGILILLYRSKNRPVTLDPSVVASALSNAGI